MKNNELRIRDRARLFIEPLAVGIAASVNHYAGPKIRPVIERARVKIEPLVVGAGVTIVRYAEPQIMPGAKRIGRGLVNKARSKALGLVRSHQPQIESAIKLSVKRSIRALKDRPDLVPRAIDKALILLKDALAIECVRETLGELARAAAVHARSELGKKETRQNIRDGIRFIIQEVADEKTNPTNALLIMADLTNFAEEKPIFERLRKMFKNKNGSPQFFEGFYDIVASVLTGYCHLDGVIKAFAFLFSQKNFSKFWDFQKVFAELTANSIFASSLFTR